MLKGKWISLELDWDTLNKVTFTFLFFNLLSFTTFHGFSFFIYLLVQLMLCLKTPIKFVDSIKFWLKVSKKFLLLTQHDVFKEKTKAKKENIWLSNTSHWPTLIQAELQSRWKQKLTESIFKFAFGHLDCFKNYISSLATSAIHLT